MADVIPIELYKAFDFAGQAAAVAASATYVGANAVLTMANNSPNVTIIPANSVIVSSPQVHEIVVYEIYSGPVRVLGQEVPIRYQLGDANQASIIAMRMIVLKAGESFRCRVFNRGPAAAIDISFALSYYEIQARVYDQVISRMREKFESEVR